MEPDSIKKFKAAVDQLRLTYTEKQTLRAKVFEHVHEHPIGTPSYFPFSLHVRAYATLALLVCLVSGGIPTVFAAQKSLPGEFLYPIKISVLEPIEETLVFTPEQKARALIENAQSRVQETAELIVQDGMQVTDIETTNPSLLEKAEKAKKIIEQIAETDVEKINLQKNLLTVLETYGALIENETPLQQDESSVDLAETENEVEEQLTHSIDSFSETAEPAEIADVLQENINEIQDALSDETPSDVDDDMTLTEEQRDDLEQTLIKTQQELTDEDTSGALKILIFSNQDTDVIDSLNDINESITASTIE